MLRISVPARRGPVARRILLGRALARRTRWRARRHLMLFGGWVWVAAISIVGIEAFEVVFGTFLLAPELLPLALLGLALAWVFRERVRAMRRRVRVRWRARRARSAGTRRRLSRARR